MELKDKEFITNFGILVIFTTICILGVLLIMTFIFFYGDPITIVLFCILAILKIRVCDNGTEVSFEKFVKKYLKISVTIVK